MDLDFIEGIISSIIFGKSSLNESLKHIKTRPGAGVSASHQLIHYYEKQEQHDNNLYLTFLLNKCLFQNNKLFNNSGVVSNHEALISSIKVHIHELSPIFENVIGWEENTMQVEMMIIKILLELSTNLHTLNKPRYK